MLTTIPWIMMCHEPSSTALDTTWKPRVWTSGSTDDLSDELSYTLLSPFPYPTSLRQYNDELNNSSHFAQHQAHTRSPPERSLSHPESRLQRRRTTSQTTSPYPKSMHHYCDELMLKYPRVTEVRWNHLSSCRLQSLEPSVRNLGSIS